VDTNTRRFARLAEAQRWLHAREAEGPTARAPVSVARTTRSGSPAPAPASVSAVSAAAAHARPARCRSTRVMLATPRRQVGARESLEPQQTNDTVLVVSWPMARH
jgi:hypothetical protein